MINVFEFAEHVHGGQTWKHINNSQNQEMNLSEIVIISASNNDVTYSFVKVATGDTYNPSSYVGNNIYTIPKYDFLLAWERIK